MKDICEELCLAYHHLLWIILQVFTLAVIYLFHWFQELLSTASTWNEKIQHFSNSGLFWLAQGCHALDSLRLFLDGGSSENNFHSYMYSCFQPQKHQLSCLPCEKCHWTSTSVDSSIVTYSERIYHLCVHPCPMVQSENLLLQSIAILDVVTESSHSGLQ